MLGSNDLQTYHAKTAAQITGDLETLVKIALQDDIQQQHNGFKIFMICPPPVIATGIFGADFVGAEERSVALGPLVAAMAAKHGVHFMDAGAHIASSDVDGVHFDEATHSVLGNAVADHIKTILI